MKINLGAGSVPEDGWVNVDMLPLRGIDIVHNLGVYPWPFESGSATNIKAVDVLEHLPNYTDDHRPGVVAFVEECWRVLGPDGVLYIQTPRFDAAFLWDDPTHVKGFTEHSFDFFDAETAYGATTGFYSEARFHRERVDTLENLNLRFWLRKLP